MKHMERIGVRELPAADRWQELIADGRLAAATEDGHVLDEAPVDYRIDASARLAALRADER